MVTQGARKCVLVVEFIYLTVKYFNGNITRIEVDDNMYPPRTDYNSIDTLCKDGMLIGPEALMSVWCWAG